jgi:hypothetical protein
MPAAGCVDCVLARMRAFERESPLTIVIFFSECTMKKIPLYGCLLWLFSLYGCMSALIPTRSKEVSIEHFILSNDVPSSAVLKEVNMGRQITADAVNPKIQTAFEKKFENVDYSEWYALDKKYKQFTVRFLYNNQYAAAVYSKGGYLLYSAAPVSENQLPDEYSKLISAYFSKYKIINIMELTIDLRHLWLVELQDARYNILFLDAEDGVLTELNRYECQKIRYRKKITVPVLK